MHVRNRKAALSGLTGILATFTIFVAAPASAAPAPGPAPASLAQARADKFGRIEELSRNGRTPTEIAKALHLVKVSVDETAGPQAASAPEDFNITIPTIYYDTDLGTYYSQSTFNWTNDNWQNDGTITGGENVGGRDMFGIRVSQPVNYVRGTLSICPSAKPTVQDPPANPPTPFTCVTSDVAFENNEFGTALSFQDKMRAFPNKAMNVFKYQYNAKSGTAWFEFGWFLSGQCHQFFSSYGHTWDESSINGVGIAVDGFSISWSGSNENWQRGSNGSGKIWC